MHRLVAIAMTSICLSAAGSAYAVNLDLTGAFAFDTSAVSCTGGLGCAGTSASIFPEGMAYNPVSDTLIVSHDAGTSMLMYEFNLDGSFTDPANPALFGIPIGFGGPAWRGLDYLSSSGTLLASGETGEVREYNFDGTIATGGIAFTAVGADDAEGIVLHSNGRIYIADDGNETIREFEFDGASWVEVVSGAFPLATRGIAGDFDDPSGIEELPGGNLLVHDDSSGGNMGFVWELDLNGMLQMINDAAVITALVPGCDLDGDGRGCVDGEALAYDDANEVFFIAYENDQRVISFPRIVPEPASAALLLLGLGGLIAARRRA